MTDAKKLNNRITKLRRTNGAWSAAFMVDFCAREDVVLGLFLFLFVIFIVDTIKSNDAMTQQLYTVLSPAFRRTTFATREIVK